MTVSGRRTWPVLSFRKMTAGGCSSALRFNSSSHVAVQRGRLMVPDKPESEPVKKRPPRWPESPTFPWESPVTPSSVPDQEDGGRWRREAPGGFHCP